MAWQSDLDRILRVFDVRSIGRVRLSVSVKCTPLAINTNVAISDFRRGVVNTQTKVYDVHQGVTNTHAIVSELQQDSAVTRAILSDIHTVVKSQGGTDDKNRSVSATRVPFT